jgi:hypothetical protein
MSFGSYEGEAYRIAEEIIDDLTQEDVEAIHRELKGLGYQAWCEWKSTNRVVIVKFVESTPRQRIRLKQFKPLMPLLVLAAFQECLAGCEFLKSIESYGLFPGRSYRSMAAQASEAFRHLYYLGIDEHWPWPWLDSPF